MSLYKKEANGEILTNKEINKLNENQNIVNFI